MNILVFNWRDIKNSWAGGSELFIHELMKRWLKQGNSVTLFCAQDIELSLPEFEIVDGVTIYRKGGRYSVYLWAIVYYIKKLRKDVDLIVDVENGIPFFTTLYSRKKRVCLVYHVHGEQFFYELPFPIAQIGFVLEKYLFPLLYKKVKIISISKSTKKKLTELGFSKNNIFIVNPGVEKNNSKSDSEGKYKKPTILYLGRIKSYKRVPILINSFPKIIEKFSNARLIIAGWGTDAPAVSDIIMKGRYRKNIEILGPVSEAEKRNLLEKSWIFVNPSIHEGWGISVIEANLYGTPAIAFDVPGLSDAIINNETGFLCKNQEDLINKINLVIENDKLRERLSLSARKWAGKFDWSLSAKQSLDILQKTLKSK